MIDAIDGPLEPVRIDALMSAISFPSEENSITASRPENGVSLSLISTLKIPVRTSVTFLA